MERRPATHRLLDHRGGAGGARRLARLAELPPALRVGRRCSRSSSPRTARLDDLLASIRASPRGRRRCTRALAARSPTATRPARGVPRSIRPERPRRPAARRAAGGDRAGRRGPSNSSQSGIAGRDGRRVGGGDACRPPERSSLCAKIRCRRSCRGTLRREQTKAILELIPRIRRGFIASTHRLKKEPAISRAFQKVHSGGTLWTISDRWIAVELLAEWPS